jgi:hypothetical protein
MGDLETEKPLKKIAEAFKELEATIKSQTQEVEVAPFSHACSLVSPLFGCLGIAFKFAEMDYVAKVNHSFLSISKNPCFFLFKFVFLMIKSNKQVHDLAEASKSIGTLQSVLDKDVERNSVRKGGSHSRNLLRVKRGLDMVRVLFEQIMVTEYVSITFSFAFRYGR